MSNARLIDAVLERTERAVVVIRTHGLDTLELTEGWASPLRSTTPGPRGVGTVSDPTAASATAEVTDREAQAYRDLTDKLAELEVAAAQVTHAIIRLKRLSPREARALLQSVHGRTTSLSRCASVLCPDLAVVGAPYCEPCATWLNTHPGVTQVPRQVILDRGYQRASRDNRRRRVYVSGPFADSELAALAGG